MSKSLFVLIGLLFFSSACKLVRKDDEKNPVARVHEHYLYEEDISGLTNGMSAEDSTVFIKNYLYNWGKEQLLIYRAEYNLRSEQKDFDELVTQYRNDLLKFAYLEKYVNENLDTAISETEIKNYYEEHSSDFELKENIVKTDYYIISESSPDLNKAKYWWKNASAKNIDKFKEYASVFASVKMVGDTNWLPFETLARKVPLPTYNQQQLLSQNKRFTLQDTVNTFFVHILSYKIKDDVSPLTYVRSTIRSIILNKRKLALIKAMEDKLVNEAFNKKEFEIF